MKTSLKRSEIIEQLKKFFQDSKSISIDKESIIVESQFSTYYVCLIHRDGVWQTVVIHLNYGWVEYEICNSFSIRYCDNYISLANSYYRSELYQIVARLNNIEQG